MMVQRVFLSAAAAVGLPPNAGRHPVLAFSQCGATAIIRRPSAQAYSNCNCVAGYYLAKVDQI